MSKKKSASAAAKALSLTGMDVTSLALNRQEAEADGRDSKLTLSAIENDVLDRLLVDEDFIGGEFRTLVDARRRMLSGINERILENIILSQAGLGEPGACTRYPENMKPNSAAQIVLAMLPVKSVYPPGKIGEEDAVGTVSIYVKDGERKGIYRPVATSDVIAWSHMLAIAPDYKWRQEFERWIRDLAEVPENRVAFSVDPDLIWMRDCIFRYSTKEHIPFSPDLVSMAKAAAHAPTKGVEPPEDVWTLPDGSELRESDFFGVLSDLETVTTIYQVIGAALRPRVSWDVIPVLYNEQGSNGKSSVLNAVTSLVGSQSWAATDLETLAGCGPNGTYGLDGLETKSLLICPDSEPSGYIERSVRLKCVVTHDALDIQGKYKQTRTVVFQAFIIALANTLPRLRDKTEAMQTRFMVVPFTAHFKRHTDQEDTGVRDVFVKRQAFIDWLAWKVLVDLPDYYGIKESAAGALASAEWHRENDNVLEFAETMILPVPSKATPDERGLYNDSFIFGPTHKAYVAWMREAHPGSSKGILGRNDFAKELTKWAESRPDFEVTREPNGRVKRLDPAKHCNLAQCGCYTKHGLLLWEDLSDSSVRVFADEQSRNSGIVRIYPEGDPPEPEVKPPANPARPFGL